MTNQRKIAGLLCGAAMMCPLAFAGSAAAQTAVATISVPALPLRQALDRIEAAGGQRIVADPDAIRGLRSLPVRNAASTEAAVHAAIAGLSLTLERQADGSLMVLNDIVVTAERDEAETDVLARAATTSSRSGLSLREQPRNTTIITSRLLAEQQAVTIADALRNAAGVTVNTATVQGGPGYSVRGYGAGGIVNGLPGGNNNGNSAGATQPIANVERIEVLKGPDALLAGAENLGGTINIVTKKPFAGSLLTIGMETGSFGQVRGTIDANGALNDSGTLSARIVGVAASADRNFGGYRGNEDYLFAPSVRFKDARTDVILGVTASDQIFGANPYTVVDPTTNRPLDRPRDQPIFAKNQGIRIGSTRLYGEATRTIGDWLTLVVRGQHEAQRIRIASYSPFAIVGAGGAAFLSASASEQRGMADAVDGYARVKVATGPVSHLLVAGATHVWNDLTNYVPSQQYSGVSSLLGQAPAPLPVADQKDYDQNSTQWGQYAQYMLGIWKLKLLAGVRRNATDSTIVYAFNNSSNSQRSNATTPNYGAILDIAPWLSVYGSLAYGYSPNFALDFNDNRLPDNRTRNAEAGVKVNLFGDRLLVNASWFELRQSNLTIADPAHPGASIGVPGQRGRGIDASVAGTILPGWSIQAGFTRTGYSYLTPSDYGDVVVGQPRDQYNLYTAYRRQVATRISAGLGGGLFGRSSAAADSFGVFRSPAARQVDLNAFLTMGALDLNFGLRNVFNRDNYNTTYAASYLPYGEPRNWRLTAAYRFK